ncbi:hypothetical protein QJS10_CPB19g01985 [Acorus calamus]|uniref:Uncharacterized protein n=1 Tax=Acorus calamus TaxID=4465 RepID=A0AAV9CEW5_ACOCL|nr:hypothetical protein QJS10_CPB19g01985 [Acorus calamus]
MEECVDEFYLSALSDHDQPFPISDQTYAEELHLQEVLMSCILSSLPNHQTLPPPKSPTREVGESSGSHVCMEEKPLEDMFKNINTPSCAAHSFCHGVSHVFKDCSALPIDSSPSVELGDSSKSSLCGICFEPKSQDEIFLTKTCEHVFCMECMGSYVASRIQDNATDVLCPDPNCDERLEMENCRPILPKEVFDRWGDALCESVILGSVKFYCPFKDCSALLIDEGVVFEESECPHCHRLFCAKRKTCLGIRGSGARSIRGSEWMRGGGRTSCLKRLRKSAGGRGASNAGSMWRRHRVVLTCCAALDVEDLQELLGREDSKKTCR